MAKSQLRSSPQPLEDVMKNLKVTDASSQLSDSISVLTGKDSCSSDAASCISSTGDVSAVAAKDSDLDHESFAEPLPHPAPYFGYYYPGYNGAAYEGIDSQGYYVAANGSELQYPPVIQADNGSLMYYIPSYIPYSPYVPVTLVDANGQYVCQQPYSPNPAYQPSIASPGYMPAPVPFGSVYVGGGYAACQERLASETSQPIKADTPPSNDSVSSVYVKPLESKNSPPTLDDSSSQRVNNQIKPAGKASKLQSDASLGKGHVPFAKFASLDQWNGGFVHPSSNVKSSGKGWFGTEKPKTKGKVTSVGEVGLANEHNHGHRVTNTKATFAFGSTGIDGDDKRASSVGRRDQFNSSDFPTKYEHACFFVVKSYSEDDVHKSIKYNVWSSTPNGNMKLDNAYQEAQRKMAEKGSKCPVFLFFSVNASGQFCGVAEMVGPVDYSKSMDFWQQDKWNGYFPVKWHIIKDVPNPKLRHIILENNENKPVTNSRDTQEVKFPQGIEMLNIFKSYIPKTSILDDFDFYESRQKVMQNRKLRPASDHKQKANELLSGFKTVDVGGVKDTK